MIIRLYVCLHLCCIMCFDQFIFCVSVWHNFFTPYTFVSDMVVKTQPFQRAKEVLWCNGCVTIIGQPGDGKTTLAEWLVTYFVLSEQNLPERGETRQKEELVRVGLPDRGNQIYEGVVVNSPADWKNKVDTSKHQIVLIDDIFGPACINIQTVRNWKETLFDISKKVLENPRKLLVIMCMHSSHYNALPLELLTLDLFKGEIVLDISVGSYALTAIDRERIMRANGGHRRLDYSEMAKVDIKDVRKSYPFVTKMFGCVNSFSLEGSKFFHSPFDSFKTAITKVYNFNKVVYFTLAVGVLFDGELELDKTSFKEFNDKQQHIIRRLKESLGAEDATLPKMRYAATLLFGVFLQPTGKHCWKYTHELAFHTMAQALANKIPKDIIELCSSDFFANRVRTVVGYTENVTSSLSLWRDEYPLLCQRFTFEILAGNLPQLASHPSFDDKDFVKAWFEFMTEMGSLLPVVQQRGAFNRSLFYWCCYYGRAWTIVEYLNHGDLAELREEGWFKEEMRAGVLAVCCGRYSSRFSHANALKALHEAGVPLVIDDPLPEEDLEYLHGEDVAFFITKMKAPLVHVTALRSDESVMEYLVNKGDVDINETSAEGYTACHRAACNKAETIGPLLRNGADSEVVAPNGRKPIHLALMCGNGNFIQTLHMRNREKKEIIKMPDGTSIMTAAIFGRNDYSVRNTMDRYDSDQSYKPDGDIVSPVQAAVAMGDDDNVKRLLDSKFKVNDKDAAGWAPLHYAVYFHNIQMIGLLLEKKANIDIRTRDLKTPLSIAAEQGYFKICEMLLDNGANFDLHTQKNEFSFSSAAKNGHVTLARYLIGQGLIVSTPNGGNAGDLRDPEPEFSDYDRYGAPGHHSGGYYNARDKKH